MAITRRKLIQLSSLSLTLLPFISACTSEKNYTEEQNLILGGGRFKLSENGPTQYVFSTVDLRSNNTSFIRLNFLPHGIHAHPDTPERLAVFEKKGPHACEIDLKNQELIREITTDSSRYFYGHGTYSADGNLLFCTESNLQSLDGIIAVRDSKSMDYLGEFPSYGKEPHECKLIDNGNILVVTNGGGPVNSSPPSVTYIDIHSEQLLETVNLTNPRINTGHMALARDGSLVVASAPRSGLSKHDLGGVSIKTADGTLQSISTPADITSKIRGEALSVIILESKHIAAITHPSANMVTFWSTSSRQLLHMIELPHPRGVTLTTDDKFFIISYDTTGKLIKVDTETLVLNKASAINNTYISGSHIYNWSRGLTEILAPGPLV